MFTRLISLCCLLPAAVASQPPTVDGSGPVATVRAALAAHGGIAPLDAAGGVVIETRGTFDLATRQQGRTPFRPEAVPIAETLFVDLAGDRVAYDLDWSNYRYSRQSLREVYDAVGRVLYVDKRAGTGGWPPFTPPPDAKARYARFLPQLLLGDALDRRATLEALGRERRFGIDVDAVRYVTSAGDALTLFIGRGDRLLHGAEHEFDMELTGTTVIRWRWSDYAQSGALRVPGRLRTWLADDLLKDVALSVEVGRPAAGAFGAPAGIDVGEPPPVADIAAFEDFTPYSERPADTRELAPGVHLLPSLRPGFHALFVEFDDFVLAVDAPTGWYEINQLPPFDFARNSGTSALTRKFIRTIHATAPGKPVRYVALTHHHSDHIGGVHAFIDDGATLLAGRETAAAVRAASRREPAIEIVEGRRVVGDGRRAVELIELPDGNPKADGFLLAWLPGEKILFFTGFVYPLPETAFPAPESVPLSLWFVRWLDASGLDPERIYNVHAQARVQDWQLERLREMLASGDYPVAGDDPAG